MTNPGENRHSVRSDFLNRLAILRTVSQEMGILAARPVFVCTVRRHLQYRGLSERPPLFQLPFTMQQRERPRLSGTQNNKVGYRSGTMSYFLPYIKNLSKRFFDKLPNIPNDLIRIQPAYDPAVSSSQKCPRALLDQHFVIFPQAKRLRA
ncbi:hypothetical protein TNCV_5371 [Trichonephila clavipes]|nr:hypothetical protein TNCV_5371 [Trichonephila clavipes]